jgi:S-adenosyl-L-methionine hydrolase (adenosine-forming)
LNISDVGRQISDFVDLDFGEGKRKNGSLQGNIVFIDSFGNILTNIPSKIVDFKPGDVLELQKKRFSFQKSYGFCKAGEPLALIGSHGYLEIAVNQGNAAAYFNKKQGDKIILRKIT